MLFLFIKMNDFWSYEGLPKSINKFPLFFSLLLISDVNEERFLEVKIVFVIQCLAGSACRASFAIVMINWINFFFPSLFRLLYIIAWSLPDAEAFIKKTGLGPGFESFSFRFVYCHICNLNEFSDKTPIVRTAKEEQNFSLQSQWIH